MPESAEDRIFCFGTFEASEAAGELRKNGVRMKLNSQPFRVLVMLLENPSVVVTREEMRRRLWGGETFVDFDHGLNTAINKIREALQDSATHPRYIETVPGKGYRFIAPVTFRMPALKEPGTPAAVEPQPLTPDPELPRPSLAAVLAAPDELPAAPRNVTKTFLLLIQAMYLAFYVGALANLAEIHEIFSDSKLLPPALLMAILITTAAILIPVRLFLCAAIAFDIRELPAKFSKLFPLLLPLDIAWSLAPFLLVHHVSTGLALAMSAALVYMPFAQRSLVLMYTREQTTPSLS